MNLALRNDVPASRLEALQARKAALEDQLREEQKHFSSDEKLKELKLQKLHLKQEIEGIRQAS